LLGAQSSATSQATLPAHVRVSKLPIFEISWKNPGDDYSDSNGSDLALQPQSAGHAYVPGGNTGSARVAAYASCAFAASVTTTCTGGAGLDGIPLAALNSRPVTAPTAGGVPPSTNVQLLELEGTFPPAPPALTRVLVVVAPPIPAAAGPRVPPAPTPPVLLTPSSGLFEPQPPSAAVKRAARKQLMSML